MLSFLFGPAFIVTGLLMSLTPFDGYMIEEPSKQSVAVNNFFETNWIATLIFYGVLFVFAVILFRNMKSTKEKNIVIDKTITSNTLAFIAVVFGFFAIGYMPITGINWIMFTYFGVVLVGLLYYQWKKIK